MRSKTKWLALVFLGLLVTVWSAGPAPAGEKMKYKGKRFGTITDRTMQDVGDVKGHVVGVSASEGVDVLNKATFRTVAALDAVFPGGGSMQGWSRTTNANGDVVYSKFQGVLEGKRTKDGRPLMLIRGTWQFVSGTGAWKGVQGSGTFKGHYLSRKVYTYDVEGEYTLAK